MENLPEGQPAVMQEPMPAAPDAVSPEQALLLFQQDPVGFIRQIVDQAAETHLADLKEEAELRAALNAFRKEHPEFARFEPFILQEVVDLLRSDPDGGNDPWDKLLEKASVNFRRKLETTMKEQLNLQESPAIQPPFVENAGNRAVPEAPPSFTREQIARMSLDEFLKNEAAINDALKNSRIR